jgi:hypothetical protein
MASASSASASAALGAVEAFGLGDVEQDFAVADVAALLEVRLEQRELEAGLRVRPGLG